MQHDQLLADVRNALMRARGLARRQAERYCDQLEPAELEAIHRAAAKPDHGPVLGTICDEIADRLAKKAGNTAAALPIASQKETDQ